MAGSSVLLPKETCRRGHVGPAAGRRWTETQLERSRSPSEEELQSGGRSQDAGREGGGDVGAQSPSLSCVLALKGRRQPGSQGQVGSVSLMQDEREIAQKGSLGRRG